MYSDIYKLIQTWYDDRDYIALHFDTSLWRRKKRNLLHQLSHKVCSPVGWNWFWFSELPAHFICAINIQER